MQNCNSDSMPFRMMEMFCSASSHSERTASIKDIKQKWMNTSRKINTIAQGCGERRKCHQVQGHTRWGIGIHKLTSIQRTDRKGCVRWGEREEGMANLVHRRHLCSQRCGTGRRGPACRHRRLPAYPLETDPQGVGRSCRRVPRRYSRSSPRRPHSDGWG